MIASLNRKLLVSVYSAQEAREAVLGGGRIIDSEDPKSALGNISPLKIMAISDAVLDCRRELDVQLSTNIGEDQLIFRRTASGFAIEKSPQEMAGKAAQAALGVALSMGTSVNPCNIVKVGLDGMSEAKLLEVLTEVVNTLRRTRELKQCPVMSVLFAQDLDAWQSRKRAPEVRSELVTLREFASTHGKVGTSKDDEFELSDYWDALRDESGNPLAKKTKSADENRAILKAAKLLPEEASDDTVVLNELLPHSQFFDVPPSRKTNREVIKRMVDITAKAGADAMMLDTSVLSKVCNICLVDTSDMTHLSPFIKKGELAQQGILSLSDLQFFVEYCHFNDIVPNLAGSIDSIQAQQLWANLPALDQLSTRSAASAVVLEPSVDGAPVPDSAGALEKVDTRQLRSIVRGLVSGLAPPEHGGVLNVPVAVRDNTDALELVKRLRDELAAARIENHLPPLQAFWFDRQGARQEIAEQLETPKSQRHSKSNGKSGKTVSHAR